LDCYTWQKVHRWTTVGWVLDGPAIAFDQGFKGSKKEGPVHFMVNFGGGL